MVGFFWKNEGVGWLGRLIERIGSIEFSCGVVCSGRRLGKAGTGGGSYRRML